MGDLRVPDTNLVIIAGRLTRDPVLAYTAGSKAYLKFGIANTQYYKGADGERQEKTIFIDVTVWGGGAEWLADKIAKGRAVLIEGRIQQSEWEDRETGQKRSKIDLNATKVSPLEWSTSATDGGDTGERGGRQADPPHVANAPHVEHPPTEEDDIPF